jgi:siroheme synthase-like protein
MSDPHAVLPVALRLTGRRCLVVGGGPVATRKVRDLLAADATIHVVAPSVTDDLRGILANESDVTWRQGRYESEDLEGAWMVITATDDRAVNQHVYDDAVDRHVWANSADDPDRCDFFMTAVVRRDPVLVAISTAGASPALASYLQRRLDADLELELGLLAGILRDARADLHRRGVSTEELAWSSVVDDELVAMVVRGDDAGARSRVRDALSTPLLGP